MKSTMTFKDVHQEEWETGEVDLGMVETGPLDIAFQLQMASGRMAGVLDRNHGGQWKYWVFRFSSMQEYIHFLCLMTNGHKLQSFKQPQFIISQFLGVRSLGIAYRGPQQGCNQWMSSHVWRLRWGGSTYKLCWWNSFPCTYRTEGFCIFKAIKENKVLQTVCQQDGVCCNTS